MTERLLRERETRSRLGNVGPTKFNKDFRPRLHEVRLSPKIVTFTESSVTQLVETLIAESGNVSVPNMQHVERAKKTTKAKPTRR
jgi:hypothetical protein